MAFSWDTFNSNRSGRGGFSDWGLSTSTSYPGSFDFGGVDDFIDPYAYLDQSADPFVFDIVGSGGLGAAWDPGLLRLEGLDYDPYELWGSSPLVVDIIGADQSASGRPRDTLLGSDLNIFTPTVGLPGSQSGVSVRDIIEEALGSSGRPRDPVMGSNANIFEAVPGLPGSQSGPSTREPGGGGGDGGGGGGGDGGGGGGEGGGVQLPSLGGLASAALGLALLRQFLGLFDRDENTYQGIDMPTVRDITAPQTPQIAPARVVPYETYAPQSRPATRFSEEPIEGLGRAEGGLASALRPHMLAVGGRADYREGAPVVGKGTGQSDDIPALLSDGEYVIDADTVAALGDGSNTAGAKVLDEFRQMIREHKRSAPADKIPPKAKSPLAYLKEAKKNG